MKMVLEAAEHSADILAPPPSWPRSKKLCLLDAVYQMQDYYNDVMEDDLIITQGDKKLKDMMEN